MSDAGEGRAAGVSRRRMIAAGGLLTAVAAGASAARFAAVARPHASRTRSPVAAPNVAPTPTPTPTSTPTPTPTPTPPPPLGTPVADVELHPANAWATQNLLFLPDTAKWFTTQAKGGTSRLLDPAGLSVGDIVVSRLSADGTFLDSMVLPDSGHGMGLIVRVEAGARAVYSCWFAAGADGSLYDVVRIQYAPGIAARGAATTVVPGLGYPLDPFYDTSANAVTVRHQGGEGPEYTRHSWTDFSAGDLSRPTGAIATPDRPQVKQAFCSAGDRFFFYTGTVTDSASPEPAAITEYSWVTGAVVRAPVDASTNSCSPDGTYPGGRVEPEGATIIGDEDGSLSLVVGLTAGGGAAPRSFPTFRYPLTSP